MNSIGFNAIAAMGGVGLLAAWALWLGYDGILFLTAVGIISGLGGYPVMKELKAYLYYMGNLENPMKRKGGGGIATLFCLRPSQDA